MDIVFAKKLLICITRSVLRSKMLQTAYSMVLSCMSAPSVLASEGVNPDCACIMLAGANRAELVSKSALQEGNSTAEQV